MHTEVHVYIYIYMHEKLSEWQTVLGVVLIVVVKTLSRPSMLASVWAPSGPHPTSQQVMLRETFRISIRFIESVNDQLLLGGGNSHIFFNFSPQKLGKMNPI